MNVPSRSHPTLAPKALTLEDRIDGLTNEFDQLDAKEETTQRSLWMLAAKALGISIMVQNDRNVVEIIQERYYTITEKKLPEGKLYYGIAVVLRQASSPEARKKAGKLGRVLPILRGRGHTKVHIAYAFLCSNGGIEGVLKLEKERKERASNSKAMQLNPVQEVSAVKPGQNPILISCDQFELIDTLMHEGKLIDIRVKVEPPDGQGHREIVYVGLSVVEDVEDTIESDNDSSDYLPT